jgi:hypothetical protein
MYRKCQDCNEVWKVTQTNGSKRFCDKHAAERRENYHKNRNASRRVFQFDLFPRKHDNRTWAQRFRDICNSPNYKHPHAGLNADAERIVVVRGTELVEEV